MERRKAERHYKAALATQRAAEYVSEEAFAAAQAALDVARRELVAAEIANPTVKEISHKARTLRLRNRGLD